MQINSHVRRLALSFIDGIEQGELDLQNATTPADRKEALSRIQFNEYLIRALARWVICYPGDTPESFISHEVRSGGVI